MRNLLFLSILSAFMLYSCNNDDNKKENETPPQSNLYMDIDASFDFVPVNSDGDNLLQAEKPLTIDDLDIVLYDENGNPYYFYNPMLGDPKNIALAGEWGGNDWVCVYLNGPKDERSNISITYLRIYDNIHTIKSEWKISSENNDDETLIGGVYSVEVTKIWFDNELVFNRNESIELSYITI